LEALNGNPVRARTASLLLKHPRKDDNEAELDRLKRVLGSLNGTNEFADLREAIRCIQQFETCYKLVMLAFERLLWICRHHAAASVNLSELENDAVLQVVRECLPGRVKKFAGTLDHGEDAAFRCNLERLFDVRQFLDRASDASSDISAFISVICGRHADIQRGKLDRGRRKMPWIEINDGRISLTMTRSGGMNWEVTVPDHIQAHPYRLNAADALNLASQRATES
jgi:hypothetical protein